MARERISFTRTLNDSGIPASMECSPLTMLLVNLGSALHVVGFDG
jgi:hypothetical protein